MTDTAARRMTVTFDRLGRNHNPAPFEVMGTERECAEQVYKHARRFLGSREVYAEVDFDTMTGCVIVGGFRPAGSCTLAEAAVCHCGRPVTGNGDEWQDRVMIDMCNPCRSVRCDTWDGECPPVVAERNAT